MKSKYSYIAAAIVGLTMAGWLTLQSHGSSHSTAAGLETDEHVHHTPTRILAPKKRKQAPVKAPGPKDAHPTIGKKVSYTPPALPDLQALKLKETETGGYMLFPVDTGESQGHMEIQDDLRDPLTAMGACTRWVVGCVDPGNRSLDDCARSVPQCTTDKPWEEEAHCCPTSCFDNYSTLRESGVEPIDAFDTVYFADGSCFPGLKELLSGATPAPPAIF